MYENKIKLVDTFVSSKISSGPRATSEAIAELAADARYQRLRERVQQAGVFEPSPWVNLVRVATIIALIATALAIQLSNPSLPVRILSSLVLGFAIIQGSFFAHEAAHGAFLKSDLAVEAIGQFFDSFLAGYSFTYFVRSHELHHFHCNEVNIDPDVLSPYVSVQKESALAKRGFGSSFSRRQHWLLPFFTIVWAYLLRTDGLIFALRRPWHRRFDLILLGLHLVLFFGVCSYFISFGAALLNYAMWSAFAGIYMFLIIPVNHVGLVAISPAANLAFIDQQVRTSRNLTGSSSIWDILFIGLNLQIEHHLFPWVPSTRLRLARPVVREFCREQGLPYIEVSFGSALYAVFRRFRELANLTPARVAKAT